MPDSRKKDERDIPETSLIVGLFVVGMCFTLLITILNKIEKIKEDRRNEHNEYVKMGMP